MSGRGPALLGGLGGTLIAAGVTVFWMTNRARGGVGDFGWSAYAPLERGADPGALFGGDGWAVLWTAGHLAGAALGILGLLILAALAGWRIGRRPGPPPTS